MKVIDFKHKSDLLGREKLATVIVPDVLEQGRRYPVYFLLHGWAGNRMSWLERTSLESAIGNRDVICVMPETGRRWLIDDHEGKKYETYFTNELVPAVDAAFPASRAREERFVGGFSMGGAAAAFIALRHPAQFGAVVAHSGAFYAPTRVGDPYADTRAEKRMLIPSTEEFDRVWGPPGSPTRATYDVDRLVDELCARGIAPPRFHLDIGTEDFPRLVGMVHRFREKLESRAIAVSFREGPGGHDWAYVSRALRPAIDFLLGPS